MITLGAIASRFIAHSTRIIVALIRSLTLIFCFSLMAGAAVSLTFDEGQAQQRKSINALTADELISLRRGVAQMKAWNTAPHDSADFRRSWVYWANMHSHFGQSCVTNNPSNFLGMGSVQTSTASNASETATWCKCEHGTDFFLTWHRMFLWYFERVLQAAAGDPSLRLPFWDYATDHSLPAAYRDQTYVNEAGQTVPNPLRVDDRQTRVNTGTPLATGIVSAAQAMRQNTFNSFSELLEATPHGTVHCAVGVANCCSGLMGCIPSSALDPIFWAHHTNIDRLYECWLSVNESKRLPSDPAHLDTKFTFVDADGSTVERRVGDMLRLSQLGYSYAQGGGCPAVAVASAEERANMTHTASASEQAFTLTGPTRLERGVTTVPISVPSAAREMLPAQAMPSTERRIHIVIDGLKFDDKMPGVLYNVYLKGDGDQREQIGVINFFNFTAPHHDSSAGRFAFDATDAIQLLGIEAAAKPSLVFEPTTGLTNSSPEAAASLISPEANVHFDSARIVIVP